MLEPDKTSDAREGGLGTAEGKEILDKVDGVVIYAASGGHDGGGGRKKG